MINWPCCFRFVTRQVSMDTERGSIRGRDCTICFEYTPPVTYTPLTRPHLLKFLPLLPWVGGHTFNMWTFGGHLSKP
jgi:hypothetical protein